MAQHDTESIDNCFALYSSPDGEAAPVLGIDLGKYLHHMEPFDYTEEQARECMAIIYQLMQTAADCQIKTVLAPASCGSIEETAASAVRGAGDMVEYKPQSIQSAFEQASEEA